MSPTRTDSFPLTARGRSAALGTVAVLTATLGLHAVAGDDELEIWVGGWNTHNVLRIALDGTLVDEFIPSGRGGLNRAHDFGFGADGDFYVASHGNSSVLRFDGRSGRFIDVFVGPGGNGLINAHTAFWNQDGTLLVSSENGHRVNQYAAGTGAFLGAFVEPGASGLVGPEFIIEGPDGRLYLATQSNQVLRLDPVNGGVVDVFVEDDPDTRENETGGMSWGHGLRFGPDGNLYVASSQSSQILRYDGVTGAFIDAFVAAGSGGLSFPIGLAFGPDDDLYVTSFSNSRILRYDGVTGAFVEIVVRLSPLGLSGPLAIEFLPPIVCTGDTNGDCVVDVSDILEVLGTWGDCPPPPAGCRADLDGNGVVDFADLLIVLANWSERGRDRRPYIDRTRCGGVGRWDIPGPSSFCS